MVNQSRKSRSPLRESANPETASWTYQLHRMLMVSILALLANQFWFDQKLVACQQTPNDDSRAQKSSSQLGSLVERSLKQEASLYRDMSTLPSPTSQMATSGGQSQPPILSQCCACDEAKYELVFEGLWSKYTHPDEWPENEWLAHFSDIIGASHSNEFVMWSPNGLSSEGVKELAESGNTKQLESELKQVSSKTRTIIKARELRQPNLNGKTSAVFRTDREHHLVSMLAKTGPSPDWMVGVSSLELCQADCSWAFQRVVNLHLWDAGTDSGLSFSSADQPSEPPERIHPVLKVHRLDPGRLTNASLLALDSGSVDPMAASRDEFGGSAKANWQQDDQRLPQMRPFARLTITRQRVYNKPCTGSSGGGGGGGKSADTPTRAPLAIPELAPMATGSVGPVGPPADCRFSDWSDWSACSATCGRGERVRTRSMLDWRPQCAQPTSADEHQIQVQPCLVECLADTNKTACTTTDWSAWSACSVHCGSGFRRRRRNPVGPWTRACQSVQLVEQTPCSVPQDQCVITTGSGNGAENESLVNGSPSEQGQIGLQQQQQADCAVTSWSAWSSCSSPCGRGVRVRTRKPLNRDNFINCQIKLTQKQSCTGSPASCKGLGGRDLDDQAIQCNYGNWTEWSECEVVCQPVKKGSSKRRFKLPGRKQEACQPIEEVYFCDPDKYC